MSHHPAAEIVAIALRKVLKLASGRKYQALQEECNAFLENIDTIIPPLPPARGSNAQLQIPLTPPAQAPPEATTQAAQPAADPTPTADATPAAPAAAQADSAAADAAADAPAASGDAAPSIQEAAVDTAEAPRAQDGPSELSPSPPPNDAPRQPASPLPPMAVRTEMALPDGVALRIIAILRSVIGSERPPAMEAALDCIQKLIAFKFLQGAVHMINVSKKGVKDVLDTEQAAEALADDPSTRTPQAQAVELMCRCEDVSDEGVELHVLKGLLTATTAATFTIHGEALLLAMRACYNIYLTSRLEVNQTTAKATLTQMVNVVFQRMEADDVVIEVKPIVIADMLGMPRTTGVQDAASIVIANVQSFLNSVVYVAGGPTGPTSDELRASVANSLAGLEGVPGTGSEPTGSQAPALDTRSASIGSQPQQQQLSRRTTSGGGFSGSGSGGGAGPTGRQGLVLAPMQQTPEQAARSAVLRNDAFLIFRGLCKLSIRTEANAQDQAAIRGKVLALELIKVLLENSGPTFRRSDTFISAIRQFLCLSLLKNSSSSVLPAAQLSCSIFLSLMSKFRSQLKAEVGVFFPMILLKPFEPVGPGGAPLQAPGATGPLPPGGAAAAAGPPPTIAQLQHKSTVLRVLGEVCRDGQLLVDLFVNYDCDLESVNLFERMVNALVRLAQQPPVAQPPSPLIVDTGNTYHMEMYLRHEALHALVHMVEAMLHWYRLTVNLVEVDLSIEGTVIEAKTTPSKRPPELTNTDTDGPGPSPPAQQGEPGSGSNTLASSVSNLKDLADDLAGATGPVVGEGGGDDLTAKRAYKARFMEGIAVFNKKPKKGIDFLQREGMLGTSVSAVATFLAKAKGLDKTQIGDYLGEREDFNIRVMHAYVDMLDFVGLEFDAAIRLFLAGFRLPGEAQKIDRFMEKFAERYLKCNPASFKSADVAYVLAYSVIMLNTDLHNPQVKKKMTKDGFVKNNRGINDGQDLPEEFLTSLYDRIATNEIKTKDSDGMATDESAQNQAKNVFTALLSIMGAFKQEQYTGPSEESIKSTLDYLHEKAKGSIAVTVTEPEAVRPMMEVIWAPLLGALSVAFDEYTEVRQINICLQGITASCNLTAVMGMHNLRDVFIHSLCGFTHLHSPHLMRFKNALAFRFLLLVASPSNIGDYLQERWVDVLRCMSRWELLQQIASGVPTDATLFSQGGEKGVKAVFKKVFQDGSDSAYPRSVESLGMSEASIKKSIGMGAPGPFGRKTTPEETQVAAEVVNSFNSEELSIVLESSAQLSSEAVVAFVRALCTVSREELENVKAPRMFSLTCLVQVAHFNMKRIRLVWSRIWAVLSDYFIEVGCHPNLEVAKNAVDSLRQLAIKFLERDELANYTFQNDFLRPFVVVMRQSQAVEIRDLIIRCVSQMVLARVDNVKSGWKSMFMVFTTAAGDKDPSIVNLAFDTVEKIVRLHFNHITETETTTFTDCVNCLIAFTNNPHSSTVALNSIAFLRYCAVKLAEGAIGDVDALPEGVTAQSVVPVNSLRVVALDTQPDASTSFTQIPTAVDSAGARMLSSFPEAGRVSPEAAVAAIQANRALEAAAAAGQQGNGWSAAAAGVESGAAHQHSSALHGSSGGGATNNRIAAFKARSATMERGSSGGRRTQGDTGLKFVDRDEHVYFWFPLLAGLSELTFDPRDQIRNSALEVLFDTLKAHGGTFAASFWRRVFDSVLMPIFDHVRAEVTDTTTFTSEKKREKEDYWLYETCRRCLQHLIDVFVLFYDETYELLPSVLRLLGGFINRTHQSLAGGGVYALTHLTNSAAPKLGPQAWQAITTFIFTIAQETTPNLLELVTPPTRANQSSTNISPAPSGSGIPPHPHTDTTDPSATHQHHPRDGSSTASGSGRPPAAANGWAAGAAAAGGGGGAGGAMYSLREGIGARRLTKFRSQAAVQLLLMQSCSDVYIRQHKHMPQGSVSDVMRTLDWIASNARDVDSDTALRKRLAMQQAEDKVPDDRVIFDPPLLRLETDAAHGYLSVLMHVYAYSTDPALRSEAASRSVKLCRATLVRFALGKDPARVQPDQQYMADARAKHQQLISAQTHNDAGFTSVNIGGVNIINARSAEAQRRAAQYASAVAAAAQGSTADRRSIIVGRTSTGLLVLMAAPSVEFAPFTPLINSTLAAIAAFDDDTFRDHLHEFFPLMTGLISAEYAPAEVLRALADLFAKRVGPILGVARAEAAAEMAAAAAQARQKAQDQQRSFQQQLQQQQQQQQQQAMGAPVG